MVWVKICRSIIVVFHCANMPNWRIEVTGKIHCWSHQYWQVATLWRTPIQTQKSGQVPINTCHCWCSNHDHQQYLITIRTWSSHDHQCYLIIIRTWLSNIRWGAILITGSQHPPLSLHLRLRSDPDQKWVKSLFTNGGLVFPWWSIKARFFRAPNTLVQISTLASLLPTSRLLSSNNTHLTGELFWTRTRFTHF